MAYIYIFIGGGIGSVLRYILSSNVTRLIGVNFPYGTLAVNITGSFFMGLIIEYLVKTMPHSMDLRVFLTVGILGGYTTFSAFSLEAVTLFERGQTAQALAYILCSVIFSVGAVFAGMAVVR